MKDTTKKAVAYLRVGGKTENEQYLANKRQMDNIEDYAKRNNIKVSHVVECFDKNDRDFKLAELIEYCRENPDIKLVLVTTFDRISRSTRGYIWWKKSLSDLGVEIRSVFQPTDNSASGQFMEAVYLAIGNADFQLRSELTKDRMQRKVEAGYSVTAPPLGYSPTSMKGLYKPNELGESIRDVLELTLFGEFNIEDCFLVLAKGVYLYCGRKLRKSQFRNMVANPYYAGYVTYKDKIYTGKHLALLSLDNWLKLNELAGNETQKFKEALLA